MNKSGKFENIEYIQVSKHGKVLKTYQANEVNGLTKAEFQQKLGKDFGQERLSLSINTKGEFTNKAMQIRGIVLGEKKTIETKKVNNNEDVLDTIKHLENKIENLNAGKESYSYDAIIEMIKQSYQIRFDALQERIQYLKDEISEYKDYIKELEAETNNKGLDMSNILSSVMQLKNVFKTSSRNQEIKDIDITTQQVPEAILSTLQSVDYNAMNKEDVLKYANLLNQFAKNLPQKKLQEA